MSGDLFELDGDERVVLRLHVQPGGGRTSVMGRHGDALKVKVAAPPEKDRANEACLQLVAGMFGVEADQVELTSGGSSRSKRVTISGLEADDARRLLAEALAGGGGAGPMPAVHDLGR